MYFLVIIVFGRQLNNWLVVIVLLLFFLLGCGGKPGKRVVNLLLQKVLFCLVYCIQPLSIIPFPLIYFQNILTGSKVHPIMLTAEPSGFVGT